MDVFEYIHIDCIREYILRRVREYVDVFANTYRHSYANCIVMSTYSRIIQCRTYSRIIQHSMQIRRHCIRVLRCIREFDTRYRHSYANCMRDYNAGHTYGVATIIREYVVGCIREYNRYGCIRIHPYRSTFACEFNVFASE